MVYIYCIYISMVAMCQEIHEIHKWKQMKSRCNLYSWKFMKIQDGKQQKVCAFAKVLEWYAQQLREMVPLNKNTCGTVDVCRSQCCLITCEGPLPADIWRLSKSLSVDSNPSWFNHLFHTYQVPSLEIVLVVAFHPFEIWRGYVGNLWNQGENCQ